jgi:hypothetical protein
MLAYSFFSLCIAGAIAWTIGWFAMVAWEALMRFRDQRLRDMFGGRGG